MEMYPGISKMFKSATGFDPDHSLVIFKFLKIDGPHYKNAKFSDCWVIRDLERYIQNVKQLTQKWLDNNNDFMIVSHTKSSASRYYRMDKFNIFFPEEYFYKAK